MKNSIAPLVIFSLLVFSFSPIFVTAQNTSKSPVKTVSKKTVVLKKVPVKTVSKKIVVLKKSPTKTPKEKSAPPKKVTTIPTPKKSSVKPLTVPKKSQESSSNKEDSSKNSSPISPILSPQTIASQEVKKQDASPTHSNYAGSYRCFSYNVSGGGGGDCRLFAPIILNKDGTYSVSSEKGTYTINNDILTLSESKLRGPGKLISDLQIRFEYEYNGWHHTITYLKESGSVSSTENTTEVPVQLILEYPAKDSTLGGIVTVELVPEGSEVKTASYKPTAIAQYDGDKRIIGSFYKATNTPQTGKKYTVYTNTGFTSTSVGTLDLTNTKTETTVTISVAASGTSVTKQTETQQSNAPDIEVNLKLIYPTKDSSLGSMNFVTLVKQGEDPVPATYKPTTTALWDGDRTITASFWKSYSRVKIQAIYTIYTDYGYGLTQVGTLDLTHVKAETLNKDIVVTPQK